MKNFRKKAGGSAPFSPLVMRLFPDMGRHNMHPPPLSARGGRVQPPTKFSKRGGGLKENLKSEIFNNKNSL